MHDLILSSRIEFVENCAPCTAKMSLDAINQERNPEDYSASSTTIQFDRPLPLLRGPLLADQLDHPSSGPYVLAFRDYGSWLSAFASSRNKVIEQCEDGARIGCAVGASKKCAPPWWDFKKVDLKAKEECEVREMNECLVVAKEKCAGFAEELRYVRAKASELVRLADRH